MPEPNWPSYEQQRTEAAVSPGSALERLIQNNQDFHLLRAEEATDKLGVPPWLRVYWRKQHPEFEYRADDPAGGYPRALKNIHTWMLTHQDLQPDSPPNPTAGPTSTSPPSTAVAAAPSRVVGADLQISGAQTSPRSESDIRVNYNNTSQIIAASNDIGTF